MGKVGGRPRPAGQNLECLVQAHGPCLGDIRAGAADCDRCVRDWGRGEPSCRGLEVGLAGRRSAAGPGFCKTHPVKRPRCPGRPGLVMAPGLREDRLLLVLKLRNPSSMFGFGGGERGDVGPVRKPDTVCGSSPMAPRPP